MKRGNDGRLEVLLTQAQELLVVCERVPSPPVGSLEELQLRLARAHAHGLVDQLAEMVALKAPTRPRTAISEAVVGKALRTHPHRA